MYVSLLFKTSPFFHQTTKGGKVVSQVLLIRVDNESPVNGKGKNFPT